MKFSEMVSLPTIVIIASTACNLKCSYCSIAKPSSNADSDDFLQDDSLLEFITQIQPSHLYISGGEPTIHPGLMRFGEVAVKYGHKISLETNGLFSLNKIDNLLDAWGESNICSIRMTPHYGQTSFEFILERAKHLKIRSIPQIVKFIGIPEVIPKLRNNMETLMDCEIGTCITSLFGEWNSKQYPRDYTTKEYVDLLNLMTDYSHSIQVFGGIKSFGRECTAGYDYLVLNQNGNKEITRCGNDPVNLIDLSDTIYSASGTNKHSCKMNSCVCDSHFIYNINLTLGEKELFEKMLSGSSDFIGTEKIMDYLSNYMQKNRLNFVNQGKFTEIYSHVVRQKDSNKGNIISNNSKDNDEQLITITTAVDDYWSNHTVNSTPFARADESLAYLDYRFDEYPLFRELMGIYGNHDGEIVLDYGCGPGNDVVGFLAHTNASKVIGIDVSEKALNLARHRLSLHDFAEGRFKLIQVSDSKPNIPLPDSSVDYIYCEGVLHHTSDPQAILKEFHRILKPNGTACIMVYNRNSIWFHLYTAYYKMIIENKFSGLSAEQAFQKNTDGEHCPVARCYLPDEFIALCSAAGFNCDYKGGYLSKTELDALARYWEAAVKSTSLAFEHRDFLTQLNNINGYPVYNGMYAGIGGVYCLQKTVLQSDVRAELCESIYNQIKSEAPSQFPIHNTTKITTSDKLMGTANIASEMGSPVSCSSCASEITAGVNRSTRSVLMLVHDSIIDRRVLDQARSLKSSGWNVTVIAGPLPSAGSCTSEVSYPDIDIKRINRSESSVHSILKKLKNFDLDRISNISSYFLDFNFQESFCYSDRFLLEALAHPASIYVAHDLPQLPAALIAATYYNAHLVYDSHELFSEQTFNTRVKNNVFSTIESLLVPFADMVMTVNESIAREMVRRYGIRSPEIILNAPSCEFNQIPLFKTDLLRQYCNIPQEMRILLFQGGMVKETRNLEELIAAMGLMERRDVALVLMGPAEEATLKDLQQIALSYNVLNRSVYFHKSVSQKDLLAYTASADAGIIPYPAIDLNTYLCTPNKLFEFTVAGVPILSNDLPELNRFISGQGIGMNLPMNNAHQIAKAIDTFFSTDIDIRRKEILSLAKQYTWSSQGEKVKQLFEKLYETVPKQILLNDGRAAAMAGNLIEARKLLVAALDGNKFNSLLLNELSKLESQSNETVQADYYKALVVQASEQMYSVADASGAFSKVSDSTQIQSNCSDTLRILVVLNYPVQDPPMRATIRDHILCFERYSRHSVTYLNLWYSADVPPEILSSSFDLIVFHTIFLSARWNPDVFTRLMALPGLKKLCSSNAVKIAIPQDEFLHTDVLCDFISNFNIQHVFSVAPESEWPAIYHKLDPSLINFHLVLTGYLDDDTVSKIREFSTESPVRNIDIGYRAWRAAYWLGRHGQLKYQIADVFKELAITYGFCTDISTDDRHTFLDNDWYKFMLKCKYFIGVEGGASILDRDGRIKTCTENYIKQHPDATFEEVEAACFPGVDGSFRLYAISPRNLEACATKTCQVLVEGDYNGILQPWVHYIPLKKDLSNLEEVFAIMKDEAVRESIVERAYQDIVVSGKYSYRSFVSYVLDTVFPDMRKGEVLTNSCAA